MKQGAIEDCAGGLAQAVSSEGNREHSDGGGAGGRRKRGRTWPRSSPQWIRDEKHTRVFHLTTVGYSRVSNPKHRFYCGLPYGEICESRSLNKAAGVLRHRNSGGVAQLRMRMTANRQLMQLFG